MNVHQITKKDELRVQKWSMGVMKKLDLAGKLNLNKYRNRQIVASGDLTGKARFYLLA